MNSPLITLANSFYVGAAVIGVPSFVVTAGYAWFRLRLWLAPAPAGDSFASVKNPDAILLILGGLSRGVGAVANFLGAISQGVFAFLAVLAGVGLLFAVALFLTGRGLHAQANWARGLGGVLMAMLFLGAFVSLLALRGPLMLAALTLAATSGYALWALWRGFAI